jgi:hypothetical protein
MRDCECLSTCAFFNDKMANMPSMAEMYKRNYCKGDSSNCARHMVFEQGGSAMVPANLYPNEQERVTEILATRA